MTTPYTPPPSTSARLHNKTALVTGGSSGIGRATCLAYASEGAKVLVADLRPSSLNPQEADAPTHELIQRNGGEAAFVELDVTDATSVEAAVQEAVRRWGRLDIMVNNAGVSFEGSDTQPIWAAKDSTWHRTLAVNATGSFYGCRAAAKQMITQEPHPSGDRGWIINFSSVLGVVGISGSVCYNSSKHLVIGLTRTAALDLAPHRVHVNAICPGFTYSAMSNPLLLDPKINPELASRHPFKGLGEPDDLARVAVFLASDDARWVTGQGIVADGGYSVH